MNSIAFGRAAALLLPKTLHVVCVETVHRAGAREVRP